MHLHIFVYLIAVGFDTKNERHHSLLLCLLMTASDLSDQTKPWDNTKHVAVRRKSLIFISIDWVEYTLQIYFYLENCLWYMLWRMFPFLWQALIYREFFSQGDMEKSLGQKPAEMMDRERARIPDLQIGFLDHIALPVYKSVKAWMLIC